MPSYAPLGWKGMAGLVWCWTVSQVWDGSWLEDRWFLNMLLYTIYMLCIIICYYVLLCIIIIVYDYILLSIIMYYHVSLFITMYYYVSLCIIIFNKRINILGTPTPSEEVQTCPVHVLEIGQVYYPLNQLMTSSTGPGTWTWCPCLSFTTEQWMAWPWWGIAPNCIGNWSIHEIFDCSVWGILEDSRCSTMFQP